MLPSSAAVGNYRGILSLLCGSCLHISLHTATHIYSLLHGCICAGYDARHRSKHFAQLAARVFMSQGIKVHLFGQPVPTPFVAAGTLQLSAAGGIMITASHNSKEYNGYKVCAWC